MSDRERRTSTFSGFIKYVRGIRSTPQDTSRRGFLRFGSKVGAGTGLLGFISGCFSGGSGSSSSTSRDVFETYHTYDELHTIFRNTYINANLGFRQDYDRGNNNIHINGKGGTEITDVSSYIFANPSNPSTFLGFNYESDSDFEAQMRGEVGSLPLYESSLTMTREGGNFEFPCMYVGPELRRRGLLESLVLGEGPLHPENVLFLEPLITNIGGQTYLDLYTKPEVLKTAPEAISLQNRRRNIPLDRWKTSDGGVLVYDDGVKRKGDRDNDDDGPMFC